MARIRRITIDNNIFMVAASFLAGFGALEFLM
jgi:hypothetical protein